MKMNRSVKTVTKIVPGNPTPVKAAVPAQSPCEALALAKQQLYLLSAGQALVAVETPQLGRVEYSKGSLADLQRYIDGLAAECAASLGVSGTARRRPISIEAWP